MPAATKSIIIPPFCSQDNEFIIQYENVYARPATIEIDDRQLMTSHPGASKQQSIHLSMPRTPRRWSLTVAALYSALGHPALSQVDRETHSTRSAEGRDLSVANARSVTPMSGLELPHVPPYTNGLLENMRYQNRLNSGS